MKIPCFRLHPTKIITQKSFQKKTKHKNLLTFHDHAEMIQPLITEVSAYIIGLKITRYFLQN